jgi:hypothetical protein
LGREPMHDLVNLLILGAFALATAGLIRLCDRS